MSRSNLVRMSGLALMLSCVLFVITGLIQLYLLFNPAGYQTVFNFISPITLVAGPLVLLGLLGLYARQLEVAGILGLTAFLVTFFGSVFATGVYWYNAFVVPSIAPVSFESYVRLETERPWPYWFGLMLAYELLYLGWLLVGVTILKTRTFPRLAAGLLVVVALTSGVLTVVQSAAAGPPDASSMLPYVNLAVNLLFNAVIAWLGFALWTQGGASGEPARKPEFSGVWDPPR